MSAAFAERERDERDLGDHVEIVTGGTHPADSVHDEVVTAMDKIGIDMSDRAPQEISTETLESCDVVATMGCSTLELDAEYVDVRDWALEDPHGKDVEDVREIRDEVGSRVQELFDEFFDDSE
jgi:arsenate reductase